MGNLLMGGNEWGNMPYLPISHKSPQGTSLKKTMLNIIYFNKINTFQLNMLMNVYFELNGTPVCLIHSNLSIFNVTMMSPEHDETWTNLKLLKCKISL